MHQISEFLVHLSVGITGTGYVVVGSGFIIGVGVTGATTVFNDISGQKIIPIGFDKLINGKLTQP